MTNFHAKPKKDRITAIVLAAGKGTRMGSPLPKVLHPVAGIPMIVRVIKTLREIGVDEIRLVVGYGEKLVRQLVEPLGVVCFSQKDQLGTANAVQSVEPESLEGDVLILNGDHPLLIFSELNKILEEFRAGSDMLSVVSCEILRPKNFGRIIRQKGELKAIVEANDASPETLKIKEVNTGIYLIKAESLKQNLSKIDNNNAKNEFYLTDLISICIDQNIKVGVIRSSKRIAYGVNTQMDLAKATKYIFYKKAVSLLKSGVMIIDPKNTYIEDYVEIEPACLIHPGVVLRGKTKVGKYSVIESNCFITDSIIKEGVVVKAMSHLEKAIIGMKSKIGPYTRLRPDTLIGEEVQLGNFVEIKKSTLKKKTKVGHLSYIGDSDIGENVNIGCGTITCNYAVDRKKYKTTIGDNVFVGSDSQFVAPVDIGDGAIIGSGSTITKNVPPNALAVSRSQQIIKKDYKIKTSVEKKDEE